MGIQTIKFKPSYKKHIKIHYPGKYLDRLVKNYGHSKVICDMKSLSIYDIPNVSLRNLKKKNIVFSYGCAVGTEKRVKKVSDTPFSRVGMDKVVFSTKKELSMSAFTCLSLMFHVPKFKLGVGLHLAAGEDDDRDYNETLFWHALYNLKKISGDSKINAYISGRHLYPKRDAGGNDQMHTLMTEGTIKLFYRLWPNMINNGVDPIFIDIGGYYQKQRLFIRNGKYHLTIMEDDPKSEISTQLSPKKSNKGVFINSDKCITIEGKSSPIIKPSKALPPKESKNGN